MVKAEALRLGLRQRAPIAERLLQENESADDIGLHEFAGSVDRAIDVAFRRQVQNHVGLEIGEGAPHRRCVGDIRPNELKARVVLYRRQRIEVAGVGKLVEDKGVMADGEGMPHEGGADKTCPARHQKTLRHQAPVPTNEVCRFPWGNARSAPVKGIASRPGARNRAAASDRPRMRYQGQFSLAEKVRLREYAVGEFHGRTIGAPEIIV